MFSIDIFNLIPKALKQKAIDTTVDFVVNLGRGYLSDEITHRIKKLRSDGEFQEAFEDGLQRAANRFVEEYTDTDEDLVEAISNDETFFQNEDVQRALLTILKKPGFYSADEQEIIMESFDSVLPQRRNRERVNQAVIFFLKCLAEEVWNLPELRPIYELQFQRMTAEAVREQVAIQKAQLQASVTLSSDIREALLQLTDVIANEKLLPSGDSANLLTLSKTRHNLPQPDYERFVGRKAKLKQIRQLLLPYPKSRHFVITIDGIGGIGKSALALEVADSYRRHFDKLPEEEQFEAIIWTTAKQTVLTGEGIITRPQSLRTLNDIYTTIAITLEREDITRARTNEQDNLVCHALTQQRTLLIIDNLETVDDERVMSFIRELPAPTKVIVTTRHRLDIAYPVRLMGMAENEGLELIEDEAKLRGVILTRDETKKLFKRTGGVPLAIVWSVAQVGFGHKIDAILTRLGQPTSDIAKFCFETAIEQIQGKSAHKLLMALALFATDASREALGYVANLPVLDRDDGLVNLEKLSLVNKKGERFLFLPLTKSFALAELSNNSDFEKDTRQRWLDYLKTLCKASGEYYWRYESYNFYNDADTILEAIDWSYQNGKAQDIFILTLAAYDYLEAAGQWNATLKLCYNALDLARSIQDTIYIARFCNVIGWILVQRGEYEEATILYSEAFGKYNEYSEADAQEGTSITLQHLGGVYRKRKMFSEAKNLCDEAWEIAENLGLGDLKALINTEYGKLARDMGDWQLAWKYFADVRDWFENRVEQTPRDESLARGTWGHLAIVAYHLNQPQRAKDLCLKSLEFFEVRGTRGYLATLKYRLALAEEALGEYEAALNHAREAVNWFDRLGMKPDYDEAKVILERLQSHSILPK